MKVVFDKAIKIAGIGLVPWTRLGLEKWLPNYAIASLEGWKRASDIPPVYALQDWTDQPVRLAKQNSQHMLDNGAFQKMLQAELPDHALLTYKPVNVPEGLTDRKFLSTLEKQTVNYEDKRIFREQFKDSLRFAPYVIAALDDVTTNYGSLVEQLDSTSLVLQDTTLSGGKGTFRVHDEDSFYQALIRPKDIATSDSIVVSKFIRGLRERSIQACVTEQGIYSGPLQVQFVADATMIHPEVGLRFCGGAIDARLQNQAQLEQAQGFAQTVGAELRRNGYRGVFGLDLLLDEDGLLYVVEANVRLTGMTPLLTIFHVSEQQVPFYLLHCLELGGWPYEIVDESVDNTHYPDCSLLILHNKTDEARAVPEDFAPGIYTYDGDGTLNFVASTFEPTALGEQELFIAPYGGSSVAPGARLLMVFANHSLVDEAGDIKPVVYQAIEKIYEKC